MQSAVFALLQPEADPAFAHRIANAIGYPRATIVHGELEDAVGYLNSAYSPKYIILDLAGSGAEILPKIDELARYCDANARVVAFGSANDIQFYRALVGRGLLDYFTLPVSIEDIARTLLKHGLAETANDHPVLAFMSAAAGDGSSTVALNTAYALAKDFQYKTILVDMDYQFGMVAKNLDLSASHSIRELFDHPERGIDETLIERMVIPYKNNFDVIAAPNELRHLPDLQPEIIRDLVIALQKRYQYVILDLPHLWANWVGAAFTNSTTVVMVAQLWLKSVTHSARLLNMLREQGVPQERVRMVINRSGAKFKEAVSPKDFERVCGKPIDFYLPNDIKTAVMAENQGKTILESGASKLASDLSAIADALRHERDRASHRPADPQPARIGFLQSLSKSFD